MNPPNRRLILIDLLWLIALAIFAFAGMNLAPFHGDEAGHIYTSRDFHTAFIERRPEALLVTPPFTIDSEPRVRLLNGSVMRYSVGLAWLLAGLTVNDLNAPPGWDWGLDYATNVATNHRPSPQLLTIARTVATGYFVLSIVALFLIGQSVAGRGLAYVATVVYTLNPVMLLNGRRALVESPYLAFGLLTICLALEIIRRRGTGEKRLRGWWIGLAVTSALCLASKYSGAIFAATAFAGILAAELWNMFMVRRITIFNQIDPKNPHAYILVLDLDWRPVFAVGVRLLAVGLAALALLVLISPALWNDPLTRARDLGTEMTAQVNLVVDILPDAPTTLGQRIEGILTEPFIKPVQHFEQASWADAAPIQDEIRAYMASALSGVQAGTIGGIILMLLVGAGIVLFVWLLLFEWFIVRMMIGQPADAPRYTISGGKCVLVLVWLAVTVANLLINPIPWQRYYLPLIPMYAVLIGMAVTTFFPRRRSSPLPETTA
jgi:4-amino-4-deoxy-L-arabinose transferase-like glycosyltransferase